MLDSDESGVIYIDVFSPFEESPDIGSPRADDHEHLELPEMLEDLYVEIVAEDQPYAEDALPNAQSPEYVPESDFEANPEDDDDEDPEEDPIPFPPLPPILSPPSPVLSPAPPPSPIRSLGYRAAMIRLRDEAASTSSPPLQLPSASRREDRPEGTPVSTNTELGGYMREFETRVRHDTNEIYMRLDDEQTERQLLAGRLNMLFKDRRAHAYTCHLMETEARMSREAWVRSTDASDLVRDHGRSTEIIELRTALQGQVTALQGQVTALQAQVTALQGQQGLAGGPTQPDL
nr:hypothetical protein [Tanacetum cinerariifolium]